MQPEQAPEDSFGTRAKLSRQASSAQSSTIRCEVTQLIRPDTAKSTRSGMLSPAEVAPFPPWLEDVLSRLPMNVNRRRGAQEVSQNLFPVSPRTLEAWPLPMRRINGQAIVSTRVLFAVAYEKYLAAPVVMVGRRKLPTVTSE